MENKVYSEPVLAFPILEEELEILEHFESDFFSHKYTSSQNCQPAIPFLAQSVTNVIGAQCWIGRRVPSLIYVTCKVWG